MRTWTSIETAWLIINPGIDHRYKEGSKFLQRLMVNNFFVLVDERADMCMQNISSPMMRWD
jgi:hypothetical protein